MIYRRETCVSEENLFCCNKRKCFSKKKIKTKTIKGKKASFISAQNHSLSLIFLIKKKNNMMKTFSILHQRDHISTEKLMVGDWLNWRHKLINVVSSDFYQAVTFTGKLA